MEKDKVLAKKKTAKDTERQRTYAQAAAACPVPMDEDDHATSSYKTARAEYEAAQQVYNMAKQAGYPEQALGMLWGEAEARKASMEAARPFAASLNASRQHLAALEGSCDKAEAAERDWEQNVEKAAKHLANMRAGHVAATEKRKAAFSEYKLAYAKRAAIFVEHFQAYGAECAHKLEMEQHCVVLTAASELAKQSIVESRENADFQKLPESCQKAEITYRQAVAAAAAAAKATKKMVKNEETTKEADKNPK